MRKTTLCFLISFFLPLSAIAQTLVPNKATPDDPNRLVDGVDLTSFQTIQSLLLEVAADDKDIALIDEQMEMLRERRADLCFKAAAKAHPELKDKLATMQESQLQRLRLEKTAARAAKLEAKKKK